jgi:hypothetical protein
MSTEDVTRILKDIVRTGEVSAIDDEKRLVRVIFHDRDDMVSGWLTVIQSPPFIPAKDITQETQPRGGGSGDAAYESHTHEVIIKPWMPKMNDKVLCLYLAMFNGGGFVLGAY